MALTKSHKEKQDTSKQVRRLTQSEIASLRQEMKASGKWMHEELKRRRASQESPSAAQEELAA